MQKGGSRFYTIFRITLVSKVLAGGNFLLLRCALLNHSMGALCFETGRTF